MLELEAQYIAEKTAFADVALDLNRWLPGLNLRALGPGDLLGIMAHTGQCKTAAVQNILACNADIAGIFFELELSGSQIFERAAAISTGYDAWRISDIYDEGNRVDWWTPGKFKNLLTCTASLSMSEIDAEIGRASAKLGCLPRCFVIDYAQLVRGAGGRYDRMSDTCEEAKRLAKKWNAIGIIISQVSRPMKDNGSSEVNLYDAKESGSFENSCGLVLSVWKTTKTEMACKVLKNTRGYAGRQVAMNLRGNSYIIEPVHQGEVDDIDSDDSNAAVPWAKKAAQTKKEEPPPRKPEELIPLVPEEGAILRDAVISRAGRLKPPIKPNQARLLIAELIANGTFFEWGVKRPNMPGKEPHLSRHEQPEEEQESVKRPIKPTRPRRMQNRNRSRSAFLVFMKFALRSLVKANAGAEAGIGVELFRLSDAGAELTSEEFDAAIEAGGSPRDIGVMRIYEKTGEYPGATAKQFAEALDSLSDVKRLHLHINSRGGEVFAAQAIYCALVDFNPKKIAYIGDLAAGTATVVMCGCDDIIAGHNSTLIVCEPWGAAIGDTDTMRKAAADLETVMIPIVSVYMDQVRGRITEKEIRRLMEDKTQMTAEEALKKGFVTAVRG